MSKPPLDMIEAAFQKAKRERDKFRREKATGSPHKVKPLHAEGLVREHKSPATECRCAKCRECLARLQASRIRMIEQRLPLAAPKPKRQTETQDVTKDGSVQRQIVTMPITLPQTVYGEIEEILKSLKHTGKFSAEHAIVPQAAQRKTRLDTACESDEIEALVRYVADHSLELSVYLKRADMIPHHVAMAIDRIRYVHTHMIADDKADLRHFLRMCSIPIDDKDPMTVREFGEHISKAKGRDFCEGAATGALRKIGQRLAHFYVRWKQEETAKQSERKKQQRIYASIRHTLVE